ncbi:unnamed protein product [Effrenium voratum]|nr:unnamed protein product [Effrenium voratum]CAJ1424897.1 unnamed protein product [Effrenium voratum]
MAEEEDLDPRWRLRRQLLRLNSLAWARAEQKETQQALRALGIPQEVDLSSVCRELGTFETQAEVEAPDLAVCDVLAFLQHATPAEQDFKKLNDSESHTAIHRIQERGLSLKKFKELYLFLEGLSRQGILPWYDRSARLAGIPLQEANFYQVNYWVIEPFTAREDMSYMEIVSDESAQRPTWFISHWWGEALSTFLKCLAKHTDVRRLSPRTSYWTALCSLGPGETCDTFHPAAKLRALLVLGTAGAFQRAWCVLEMGLATAEARGKAGLDVVAMRQDARGLAVVLTDGLTDAEQEWEAKHPGMGHIAKTDRESSFPLEVLSAGLSVDFSRCEASGGRSLVLAALSKLCPAQELPAEEVLNQHLRSFFARTALVQVLHRQLPVAPFLATIAGNTLQQDLWLPCLAHVLEDPEGFLLELLPYLVSMPLRRLRLDLGWRSLYANGSVSKVSSCSSLSGLGELGGLRDLELRLSGSRQLRSLSGFDSALGRLQMLQRLDLRLDACDKLQSVGELGKSLGQLSQLRSLDCHLGGCQLSDRDVRELGRGMQMLFKLQRLSVDLSGIKQIFYLWELGKCMRFMPELQQLEMDFSLCINLSDISELGNSVRILLTEMSHFGPGKPNSSFALRLEKSGVRINREKVAGYRDPDLFVKALGSRALSDFDPRPAASKAKLRPVWLTHLQEVQAKRSFLVPMGCQGLHRGCPRLY